VCHSPFDEGKLEMLLCDICNAGWHMDCLLPPHTTIPAGIWKCPLCTPPAPSSQGPLRHLRFPSPILDPDSDQTPPRARKKETPSLVSTKYYFQQRNQKPLSSPPVTNSGTTTTCRHIKRGLKTKFSTVVCHEGDLEPQPRQFFPFGFFPWVPGMGEGGDWWS